MKKLELSGRKFNKLTVISYSNTKKGNTHWNVKCDCGNSLVVNGSYLLNNHTKSCGCLQGSGIVTHGKTQTLSYETWGRMKTRCLNAKNKDYKYYGGRGITICNRWRNSFENFYKDMGDRPDGMTLERIDNSKGYEPNNCKWATHEEQCNNKRNNCILTYRGISLNLVQWAKRLRINKSTLYWRIRQGWPIQKAFATL